MTSTNVRTHHRGLGCHLLNGLDELLGLGGECEADRLALPALGGHLCTRRLDARLVLLNLTVKVLRIKQPTQADNKEQ